jgi:V-type H+-transporting ATPase subunit d
VGGYFEDYLDKKQESGDQENLSELDLEIMRASLKKSWLEDFFAFCSHLPWTTQEIMEDILNKQADFLCLSVTLNSLNSPMGGQTKLSDRNALFPHFGYLYPAATEALRKATNEQTIRAAIDTFPQYLEVFEQCRGYYIRNTDQEQVNENQLSLEDALYRQELTMYEMAFEQQMHYGVFYAWVKLKEQEIRNILWVADMILMNRRDTCMDMVLPIFAPRI